MTNVELRAAILVFAILVLACSCNTALEDGGREIGVAVSALSVCEEVVPANRNVDGIPAYKQCSASENSAIYSNDGVNTTTMKMGPDWIETQYDNGYQCTELVQRYLHFRWHIDWLPRGDAGFWCDSQPPANSGLVQTMKPVHGDIMVLAPGSCGSSDDGHVMLVDIASGTSLIVVEQNEAMRGPVELSCAKCFLHVVANDGSGTTAPPGGTAGSGAAGSGAAGSGAAGSGAPAGSASPPPTMPPPMTTPPAMTMPPAQPPATPPPAAQPPATPVPNAAPEPTAGTQAQLTPSTRPSAESATTADSGGCSIVDGAGAGSGPGSLLVVLAAAGLGLARRRRSQRAHSR